MLLVFVFVAVCFISNTQIIILDLLFSSDGSVNAQKRKKAQCTDRPLQTCKAASELPLIAKQHFPSTPSIMEGGLIPNTAWCCLTYFGCSKIENNSNVCWSPYQSVKIQIKFINNNIENNLKSTTCKKCIILPQTLLCNSYCNLTKHCWSLLSSAVLLPIYKINSEK